MVTRTIYLSLFVFTFFSCVEKEKIFFDSLQPVSEKSGFKMDGYWVWGGSVVKVDSTFHMFASRWPRKNKFPDDYFVESEIVHATSSSAEGPFSFQRVVIGERDSIFWDSNMAHNPTIHKIGDEFVLFYIGSDFTTLREESNRLIRRVGYATAKNINGPWKRSELPVLDEESNNPALFVENDGSVKLMYRDAELLVKIASADNFRGPYKVVNKNVWPTAKIEDFYLYRKDGKYHMICEDNVGQLTGHERWGAHLISENGIDDWQKFAPVVVYDHDIIFEEGDTLHCVRRERPQLLINNQNMTHLYNGVYDGINSWCQPVKIVPSIKVD
ncbi:hypothetical protein GM418_31095 [Maribellus comscasis]|uniref:Glycosyl hydrolase family 43 n=1 Tax=Maribellus comscasis TaxID=2681766 RepID=A0A6I6KCB8_9BACT|nr:glycoside hydrolase family protein [Maribellus comscasis]QGY47944.1 hypothetical protein GM418_31095 [Maribellus comscasis]